MSGFDAEKEAADYWLSLPDGLLSFDYLHSAAEPLRNAYKSGHNRALSRAQQVVDYVLCEVVSQGLRDEVKSAIRKLIEE